MNDNNDYVNTSLHSIVSKVKNRKSLIEDFEKFSKRIKSPAKAKKFLVSSGVIDKKGQLTKPYKDLCTQPVQV